MSKPSTSKSRGPLLEALEGRTLLSGTVAATTAVTLSVSTASATLGQNVTVTMQVKASKHGARLAGTFELLDNGSPIEAAGSPLTVALKGGKAKYVFGSGNDALFTGSHDLSAEFVSKNSLPSSTSTAEPVTITAPTFTTTADGLGIASFGAGHGKAAKAGNTVKVAYTGLLAADGTVFDYATAPDHGAHAAKTLKFKLGANEVIPGFDEGITGMKPGQTRVLDIPSALGYGASGSPPAIPANAELIFLVTLK